MNSKEYFYRVKLSIKDIPGEKDLIDDVQDFKRDYLFNSKGFAEAKFQKGLKGIESNSFNTKIPGAKFSISRNLVVENDGQTNEYVLQNANGLVQENIDFEKSLINQELERVRQEMKMGFLRYSESIVGKCCFKRLIRLRIRGAVKEEEQKFGIFEAENVQDLLYFIDSDYITIQEQADLYPEEGDFLDYYFYLIDETGEKAEEHLLYHNKKIDELSLALAEELGDKHYMETSAGRKPLSFGLENRPSLWDLESEKCTLENASPDTFYRITEYLVEANSQRISDSTVADFKETKSKLLFHLSTEVKDIYMAKLYQNHPFLQTEENFNYYTKVTLSLVKNGKEYPLYHPNTKEFCAAGREFEAKLLAERRKLLNERVSIVQSNYEMFPKISKVLDTVEFVHYCVFEGECMMTSKKKKSFFNHDLVTARKQANSFFEDLMREQIKVEEGTDPSKPPTVLAMHSFRWRDSPFYLRSTAICHNHLVDFGLKEEQKVLRRLGFLAEPERSKL